MGDEIHSRPIEEKQEDENINDQFNWNTNLNEIYLSNLENWCWRRSQSMCSMFSEEFIACLKMLRNYSIFGFCFIFFCFKIIITDKISKIILEIQCLFSVIILRVSYWLKIPLNTLNRICSGPLECDAHQFQYSNHIMMGNRKFIWFISEGIRIKAKDLKYVQYADYYLTIRVCSIPFCIFCI